MYCLYVNLDCNLLGYIFCTKSLGFMISEYDDDICSFR